MNIFKKAIPLLLCGVMALSAVSCGNDDKYAILRETDPVTEGTIITLDGEDIDFDLYRYFFVALKENMSQGNDSYWEGKASPASTDTAGNTIPAINAKDDALAKLNALKTEVETYLKHHVAVENYAKKNNISLTEEEIKKSTDEIAAEKKEMGDDAFKEYLDKMACSEDVYLQLRTTYALQEKIVLELFSDRAKEGLNEQYKDQVRTVHILRLTNDAEYDKIPVPEDATDAEKADIDAKNKEALEEATEALKAKEKALSEEILAKIDAGEDFDKLIEEYGEDPGLTPSEDGTYEGYTFGAGDMVEEFEECAFALKDNEVSDIVETSYGYHIIKRLPIDEEWFEKNAIDVIMQNTTFYTEFSKDLDAEIEAIELKKTDLDNLVNIQTLS